MPERPRPSQDRLIEQIATLRRAFPEMLPGEPVEASVQDVVVPEVPLSRYIMEGLRTGRTMSPGGVVLAALPDASEPHMVVSGFENVVAAQESGVATLPAILLPDASQFTTGPDLLLSLRDPEHSAREPFITTQAIEAWSQTPWGDDLSLKFALRFLLHPTRTATLRHADEADEILSWMSSHFDRWGVKPEKLDKSLIRQEKLIPEIFRAIRIGHALPGEISMASADILLSIKWVTPAVQSEVLRWLETDEEHGTVQLLRFLNQIKETKRMSIVFDNSNVAPVIIKRNQPIIGASDRASFVPKWDVTRQLKYHPDQDGEDLDVVPLYMRECNFPLLTQEEEVEISQNIERGRAADRKIKENREKGFVLEQSVLNGLKQEVLLGSQAKKDMATRNTRLVISMAKRYIGQGVPFPDLIQEGNLGLMRAVEKFDWQRGNKFSTYAMWWVRVALTRALADQGRTIRVPVHRSDFLRRIRAWARVFEQDIHRQPTVEEIAHEFEKSPTAISTLLRSAQAPISLEKPVGDGDSEFGEFISDEEFTLEEKGEKGLLAGEFDVILGALTAREERVLILRYGLNGRRPHTLKEVGVLFGITRERVRQIEVRIMSKLRQPKRSGKLRDLL